MIHNILLKASRGISAETWELDYVFPPNDFSSDSETQCKLMYIFCITNES